MTDRPGKFTSGSGSTTEEIRAHGDVATRKAVIWSVGIVLCILAVGGIISFICNPDKGKDIWVMIGPILAAGVTALCGHLSNGKGKR